MAHDEEDLKDAIRQAAIEPKRASDDSGMVEHRSISELIEADRYTRNQNAASNAGGFGGLRFRKMIPPAAGD